MLLGIGSWQSRQAIATHRSVTSDFAKIKPIKTMISVEKSSPEKCDDELGLPSFSATSSYWMFENVVQEPSSRLVDIELRSAVPMKLRWWFGRCLLLLRLQLLLMTAVTRRFFAELCHAGASCWHLWRRSSRYDELCWPNALSSESKNKLQSDELLAIGHWKEVQTKRGSAHQRSTCFVWSVEGHNRGVACHELEENTGDVQVWHFFADLPRPHGDKAGHRASGWFTPRPQISLLEKTRVVYIFSWLAGSGRQ